MRRTVKKILLYGVRSFLVIILILLLGITGLYFYMNTAPGKRFLASELSYYIGKTFGTEFSIGKASWEFPATVSLENVVIKDQRQHDMFVIGKLDAGMVYFNYKTGKMIFSKVLLKNIDFNLVLYKGDTSSNFGYVIDRLTHGTGAPRTYKTNISFRSVELENLHFKWDDQRYGFISYPGIDWNHVDVSRFDGVLSSMKIDGDDVSADIKNMDLIEKSGFRINKMTGNAKYTDRNIEVKNLDLITPDSRVRNHIRIDYANTDSMVDFVKNVDVAAQFTDSKVSFKDLKYFTPDLKNKTDIVNITRLIEKGKISDMHISNLDASFGKYSMVKGRVDMQGLPDISKTFMVVRLNQTRTSKAELEKLFPEIVLPEALNTLGQVSAKGYFTGFINDFKTNTDFETALGKGNADLEIKISPNDAQSQYSGKINLDQFDIGKLSGENLLGHITINGEVSGKGLTMETVQARLVADIKSFDFKNYKYQNININGDIAKKFFNGSLNVNDHNLALKFNGSIDFRKSKPQYAFIAIVPNANLYALNLAMDTLTVSTNIKINASGIKPDDIEGFIIARNTRVTIPGKIYDFDSVSIQSKTNEQHRIIDLYSDILQAKLDGNFQISTLGDLFKSAARQYIDSGFYTFANHPIVGQNINFDIRFIHLAPVFSVLRTRFSVSDSGYLKGSYSSDENELILDGNLPKLAYNNLIFKNLSFTGRGNTDGLDLGVNIGAFVNNDTELVKNAVIKISSNPEKLTYNLTASDEMSQKQILLNGTFDVSGKKAYMDLTDSKIKILNNTWNINSQRITFYSDTMVEIPEISFVKGGEKIRAQGSYSTGYSYPIRIIMEDLDMATVGSFVPQMSGVGGLANGQILINNINSKPIIESALYISYLAYNTDTFGTLSSQTEYSESSGKLSIDAKLYNEEGQDVADAAGAVNIDQTHGIAMNVNLNQTEIKVFEPFINYVFSDLKGQATANMIVSGTLSQPSISGKITLDAAEFKVNYTNVKYHFSHTFNFNGQVITIKDLKVYDPNNNIATVNGSFDLKNLSNISLDLKINAYKVLALNTTQKINDLYFGKGYGTGRVSISGPLDNLKFTIKMRTEKGTTFSMPINSGNSFYGYDYIKFINKSNYLKGVREVKLSGIELSMELEITPDAFGQIIFDPRVGDIIEGRGRGNLRLDVNTDGDFTMFGTYTITDGKYRFTAFDGLINKSFTINSGSTITWNGSPYEAQLDMQAIYTVRTSLSSLNPMTGSNATIDNNKDNNIYDKVYPVEAILNLKGSLFQPEIRLDFNIEELNQATAGTTDIQTRVNQIKSNQQDIDQQVVSLLVLNQFAPVDQASNGFGNNNELNSALNSSIGDLVASQVNDWLAKVPALETLHVGLNRTQQEFSVKLSRDLFQQRANISVSYDFDYNNYNTQLAYKISPDGNKQLKIFGRSNNNPVIDQNSNTQGVGYSVRIEFDKISELFRKRNTKGRNTNK